VDSYISGMQRAQHLALEGCVLRLRPGDVAHEDAARQWEETFGVARSRDLLAFTNAKIGFTSGREGQHGGLVSITIGVQGRDKYDAICKRASDAGIHRDGCILMCGIKWYLILLGQGKSKGKL
jgi:hypothetical protein